LAAAVRAHRRRHRPGVEPLLSWRDRPGRDLCDRDRDACDAGVGAMRAPVDNEPREPPHNVELEQALLGGIFVSNAAFQHVSSFLRPEHFYEPLHGKLFEITAGLIAADKVANPVTLKDYLPPEIKKLKIGRLTVNQYLAHL